MDPITILMGIAPLGVEFGKALIAKYFGAAEFKPSNLDQWLQMRGFDLELFKAMNDAGGANPSYPWVEAIIRLQRPAIAIVALCVWGWSHTVGIPSDDVNNFTGAIGFYLFGDRTLFYLKKASGK